MSNVVYLGPTLHPVHAGPVAVVEGSGGKPVTPIPVVHWYREATYELIAVHHGVDVVRGGTYCDVGPLFSGLQSALDAARRYAADLRIDEHSTLHVELRLTVVDQPLLVDEPEIGRAVRRAQRPPEHWRVVVPNDKPMPLRAVALLRAERVWSTSNAAAPVPEPVLQDLQARPFSAAPAICLLA